MPRSAGTPLGPYDILSALGAGGLGEFYRARHTKLRHLVRLVGWARPARGGAGPSALHARGGSRLGSKARRWHGSLLTPLVSTIVAMLDTHGAKLDRYHELLRLEAPHDRLAQAMRLSRSVRELALAGIAMRHPGASEHELRVRLAVRLYGRDLAQRVFGSLPSDAI